MWKDKSSIQTKFLNKMTYTVFISVGLWCLIWIQGEYSTFKSESNSLRSGYIQSQKVHLKNEVGRIVQKINAERLQAEKKLEIFLEERVNEAYQITKHIYQQNVDSKSLPEIEKMIKDALRPVRFNDGRGYYFAVSLDGIEQLYPVKPEFEGKNIIELQDSKGNFFIQDEIDVIKRKGEGFVKDFWTKPDKDPSILYDKISFIKYFKPLNWYLGTGEYLDKSTEQVQEEILKRISNLRFGTEGYFFGSTYRGEPLFSNGKITMSSSSIWELTDPNGVKIIQEQIKAGKNPEGEFVRYSWNKLNTKDLSPKISFVQGISEWEWIIGAGVYLDTIEATISENKTALISGLKKRIARSMVILAGLLCLIFFWSKRISNQIQKSVNTFSSFLEKARTDSIFIDPDSIQLMEFKDIAVSTNKMLEEKRKANDALKDSENKYRNLLNTIPYGVQLTDLEGKITYSNLAHHQIQGYADGGLLGKHIWDRIVDEEKKLATKEYYQSILKERPHPVTYFTMDKTKDGRVIDTQIDWDYIQDTKGEIEGIISIISDITERKRSEIALKESEEKYRTILNEMSEGYHELDLAGNFTFFNEAFLNLFGYSKGEMMGRSFSRYAAEEIYAKKLYGIYNEMFKTGLPIQKSEWDIIRKDGERITLEFYASVVKDSKDIPTGFRGIVRDITDRKRTEKALQESETKFRSIFENKGTAIGVYGEDSIIKECNTVFEEMSGYSKFEIIEKKKWSDFVVNEDLERIKKYHTQRSMNGESPPSQYECGIIHRSGEVRTVLININLVGVDRIVSLTDISARKLAEEEQKKLQERLIQAQKMEAIGTLAGGIAHDFNNILSGIFGYSQLAEMHIDDPEKAKAHIRNIVKGASRATQLVQQILTFSRKTNYEKQYFKLFNVVREALTLIRSTIPATIEINVKFNSKALIYADPIQMHQIIMNLCTNAYHAMSDSGGKLTVKLDETYELDPNNISIIINKNQKYLKLEISDTGHGMDKRTREKIFDPYFTTKTREKGTGLGLALVRAIVEEHGGTISVDSIIGKGSTFLIYLPIAEQKSNMNIKGTLEKEIPTGTESILFVDDEDDIRFSIQDFLESYGYALTVSENGQKAYEVFKRAPQDFDIVITDMAMPKMNGNELALEILKIRKDIPIILCTGYSENLNEEQAKKMGIARYINKPIAGKELCFLIREVLNKEKKCRWISLGGQDRRSSQENQVI